MDEVRSVYTVAVALFVIRNVFQFYILYRVYLFIIGFKKFTKNYLVLQEKILSEGDGKNEFE